MSFLKILINKNFLVGRKHFLLSTFLLFFPVIVLFWISLFLNKQRIEWADYEKLNHNPIVFHWHKKSEEGQLEVDLIRKDFTGKTIGIIYEETNTSKIKNYNNNTFDKYISDETKGICVKSKNCTWKEFRSETDYISQQHNNNWKISEWISLEVYNGYPQYKIYSRLVPIYSRQNQISEWYNIPTMHGAKYAQALQVYFAKYLIEITRDKHKDQLEEKEINISLYPMYVELGIKKFDQNDINDDFPKSCIIYHTACFIISSSAFISIVILFTQAWIKEKLNGIVDLLKYQGISKLQYILSWFITYVVVNIIPMMLFIIYFTFFWVDLLWNCIVILTAMVVLNYLNIFVFCFWCTSFIDKNNTSNWGIYVLYWAAIILYGFFWYFDELPYIWEYCFYFIPNINFALSLELIFLLSNYETGATVSRLFMTHKDTNIITILFLNIFSLILWVIILFINESRHWSSKHLKRLKNIRFENNNIVKLEETNSINDNTFLRFSLKQKFEQSYESLSDLNLIKQLYNNECLQLRDIVKKFGDYIAVNNISLDWFHGQIFVLLGHNGAGKTTLLNVISGDIAVDQGNILLENHSWLEDTYYWYNNLGLCGQEDIYFPDLTVYEQIELISSLKGNNKDNNKNIIELINCLGWQEYAFSKASSLSCGNLRKLCVAFAWLGNSKLVILDEPTSGMDFKSKKLFWDFLKTVKKNRIIILTTHSMDEAEYWADDIGIMSEGELICRGSAAYLKRKYPCGYNINFVFLSNKIIFKEKCELIKILRKIEPGMTIKVLSKDWIKLNFPESSFHENKTTKIWKIIEKVKDKYSIKDYTISTTSLEDVFFKINDNDFTRNLFETELGEIMKTRSEEDQTLNYIFLEEKKDNKQSLINEKDEISLEKLQHCTEISDCFDLSESDVTIINDKNNFKMNSHINIDKSYSTWNNNKKMTSKVTNQNILRTAIESKNEKFKFNKSHIWKNYQRNLITFYRNIFGSLGRLFVCLVMLISHIILKPVTNYFNIYYLSNFFPKSIQSEFKILNKETNSTIKEIEEWISSYENMFSLKEWDLQFDLDKEINYTHISYSTIFNKSKNFLLVEYNQTQVNYIDYYALSSPDITYVMLNCIIRKQWLEVYNVTTYLFNSYTISSVNFLNQDIDRISYNIVILSLLALSHWIFSLFCIARPFSDSKSEVKTLIKINIGNMNKYWIGLFLFDYTKFVFLTILIYFILSLTIDHSIYLVPISFLFGINIILLAYLSTFFFQTSKATKLTYFAINIIPMWCYFYDRQSEKLMMKLDIVEFTLWDILPITSIMHYFYDIQTYYLLVPISKNEVPFDFDGKYKNKILFSCLHFLIQFIIIFLSLCEMEANNISDVFFSGFSGGVSLKLKEQKKRNHIKKKKKKI